MKIIPPPGKTREDFTVALQEFADMTTEIRDLIVAEVANNLAKVQPEWERTHEQNEHHRLHKKFDLERRTEMSEHCKFGIGKCDSMEDVRHCLESAIDFASSLNDTLCTEKHPDWWHAGEAVDSLLEVYFYMFGPRPERRNDKEEKAT